MSFHPAERPSGLIVLRDANSGSLSLQIPQDVTLSASLDSDERRCFVAPSDDDPGCCEIHYRTPIGTGNHRLEVLVRSQGVTGRVFSACTFRVTAPFDPERFVEPFFPKVHRETFLEHGLSFREPLPVGRFVLSETNQISIHVSAPPDVLVVAELVADEGDGCAVDGASTGVQVTARCPVGEHRLCILVKWRGAKDGYREALSYSVFVDQDCCEIFEGPFDSAVVEAAASEEVPGDEDEA